MQKSFIQQDWFDDGLTVRLIPGSGNECMGQGFDTALESDAHGRRIPWYQYLIAFLLFLGLCVSWAEEEEFGVRDAAYIAQQHMAHEDLIFVWD